MARKVRGRKHKRPAPNKPVVLTVEELRMKGVSPEMAQQLADELVQEGRLKEAIIDPQGNMIAVLKEK